MGSDAPIPSGIKLVTIDGLTIVNYPLLQTAVDEVEKRESGRIMDPPPFDSQIPQYLAKSLLGSLPFSEQLPPPVPANDHDDDLAPEQISPAPQLTTPALKEYALIFDYNGQRYIAEIFV